MPAKFHNNRTKIVDSRLELQCHSKDCTFLGTYILVFPNWTKKRNFDKFLFLDDNYNASRCVWENIDHFTSFYLVAIRFPKNAIFIAPSVSLIQFWPDLPMKEIQYQKTDLIFGFNSIKSC